MAEHVLVIVAQPPKGLGSGAEALAAGRALAGELGLPLACALLGRDLAEPATEAAERGADRVLVAEADSLVRFSGDAVLPAAAAAVGVAEARVVLVSRFADQLELCHRLAARLDGASVTGVTEVRRAAGDIEAVATAFGGAALAVYRFDAPGPRVLGVADGIARPLERQAGRVAEREALEVPAAPERVRLVAAAPAAEGARLEDAKVVVAGGRGLGAAENYAMIRELAGALGGMPGASRAIVDDGWAQPAEQIGLTGKIVAPELYVAMGISGASQHMMGCSNARTLVAVNSDPGAPIFRYADYGIVDDCRQVLPELIRLARSG